MVSEQSLASMLQTIVVSIKDMRDRTKEQQETVTHQTESMQAFQSEMVTALSALTDDLTHIKEEQAALKRLVQNTREMVTTTSENVVTVDNKVNFLTEVITELSTTLLEEDNDVTERFDKHLIDVEQVVTNAINKEMTDNYVTPIKNLAEKTGSVATNMQQIHESQEVINQNLETINQRFEENSTIIATTAARVDSLAEIKKVEETSTFTPLSDQSIDDQLEAIEAQLANMD